MREEERHEVWDNLILDVQERGNSLVVDYYQFIENIYDISDIIYAHKPTARIKNILQV